MIKKSIICGFLFVVFVSCGKDKYVAEFSYTVNGERFMVKGGGLGYAEWFAADTLNTVLCYSMLMGSPKENGELIYMEADKHYNFFMTDTTGGQKTHFDVQKGSELNNFCITYKGNLYWAISGFIDLKKENTKKVREMEIKGTFEAVMVYPLYHSTDTIIVKNGSFYYSHISYGSGSYN
jgi:hypothetical protein